MRDSPRDLQKEHEETQKAASRVKLRRRAQRDRCKLSGGERAGHLGDARLTGGGSKSGAKRRVTAFKEPRRREGRRTLPKSASVPDPEEKEEGEPST